MTNKEIDKLLCLIDKNGLDKLKNYLIKEKEKNNNLRLQRTFEKYLSNNAFGFNCKTLPRYCMDYGNGQVITNGISIYYFNQKYFKITDKITKHYAYNRASDFMDINQAKTLLERAGNFTKHKIGNPFYIEQYIDSNSIVVSIIIDKHIKEYEFNSNEYDVSNILLDNPTYTVCNNGTSLYGESDKGKVYILGYKSKN